MLQERLVNLFYTGLSFVGAASNALQKTVNQLITERRISPEEGRKIVDEFIQQTGTKKEEFESQLVKIQQRIAKNLHFATSEEVEELKQRISQLEEKLEKLAEKK